MFETRGKERSPNRVAGKAGDAREQRVHGKIEKSGACIRECVPRACIPPVWFFFSFAGRIYTERARLPSYRAATLAFVDSAKCPWIFPGLPMPADQPDISRSGTCKRFLVTSRPVITVPSETTSF